jgi:anti-sigma B factor antagonist
MTIEIVKGKEETVLMISGRLDTNTASVLEKTIREDIRENATLVLDMKELEYISSAGLRVLLSAQKRMQRNGAMKLIHVCEIVKEVLELTGFADILDIES